MPQWNQIAADESIEKAKQALTEHGMQVQVVENGAAAKEAVLKMLPAGAEVMDMTSETLRTLGLHDEINESGRYDSVKNKLKQMNRETQQREMQRLGAAPEYAVGSAHAVTEDGKVVVASRTGSQLPAYVYGADHVIWVIGAQKIVANQEVAIQRIYEYILPLESERVKVAYKMMQGSFVSKLLIFNQEFTPNRINIIIVKEVLGF